MITEQPKEKIRSSDESCLPPTLHKSCRSRNYLSLLLLTALILLNCLAAGCDRSREEPIRVSLNNKIKNESTPKPPAEAPIRLAIATVISPKQTYVLYKELLDYISLKLDRPVQLVQRETYQEINDLIEISEIELAFVCGGAYVDGHADFGMELLVAPLSQGKPLYYSYIIVPASSSVSTVEELRGKRFAFSDPLSNSGKLSPTYILAQMGEDVESFFQSYTYTRRHDLSVELVANNLVDGAAVDSLIWDYMNKEHPHLTSKTKIIEKSGPYGIPPVVVPQNLSVDLKTSLRNLFLQLNENETGRHILDKLLIDKFVEVDDSLYDSIREMKNRTAKQ